MKLHESWRHIYRKNRYLRHLTEAELAHRGKDTLNNPLTLGTDAKIGLLSMENFGTEAMERFTHFLEECELRGLDYRNLMRKMNLKETMPDFTGELGKRAATAIKNYSGHRKTDLVKFGKAEYLGPLLAEGKLRVQPASSFVHPDHNQAVADNELRRTFKMAISGAELQDMLRRKGILGAPAHENPEIEVAYFTDYWVTCFSLFLQPRMSVDFESDAALIIHDKGEFRRRLRSAVREVTSYSKMKDGAVKYFDPYLPNVDFRAIPLIKPLRYYYQQEYRYFWLPDEPTTKLKYVDVEMGSVTDITSLVTW